MMKLKKKIKSIFAMVLVLLLGTTGALVLATNTSSSSNDGDSSYVELYSPLKDVDISTNSPAYFQPSVKDTNLTESGKGLVLDYTVFNQPVTITVPTGAKDAENFEGLAVWVDVPLTADSYSFTMYIENETAVWQTMELGSKLTYVPEVGDISTVNSIWKRQQLNGFRGWVLLPKESYPDATPNSNGLYNVIFMIEYEPAEGFYRTEDIEITIGSIGYYTDYTGVLYEFAGAEAMVNKTLVDLEGYISEANALNPKNDNQLAIKNEMLVYFSNVKANFAKLSVADQVEITKGLYDQYYAYMEKFLYGDIMKTDYIMSFAVMSDTHFSETWVNERFLYSLDDAKTLNPNLAAALVLGDISNEGVSVTEEPEKGIYTELDDYYDWLDSYEYKDANGNDIPIINVLGNHDVRGHHLNTYPTESYAPAIEMYLQREKLAKEAGSIQFDTWINGYHFIFLNTDAYPKQHDDNCYLSAETIAWLDETLSENEDGRPMFVMVHQPKGNVFTLEGAEMTFEEVIAKHPSTIVSSGHTHDSFGTNKVIQEGNGVYINQPALVEVSAPYYMVEVYEGGVIYRAREAATQSWLIGNDVAVVNEDMRNNVVFSSDTFDLNTLPTNVDAAIVSYDSVSGCALQLVGNASGKVELPIPSRGENTKYAGYALFVESDSPVALTINGQSLNSGSTYYSVQNGSLVAKIVNANGEVAANGWVVIPKDAINGDAHPIRTSVLSINVNAGQTINLDQVSYYFDINDFVESISELSYTFYSDDNVISYKKAEFGSEIVEPTNVSKDSTPQYAYTFIGWDTDGDGNVDQLPASLKGNLVAHAIYEETIRQYTYILYAEDGTILVSKTVDYGTKVDVPKVNKLFGWDVDGDGAVENLPTTVTEDFTAVAIIGEPPYKNAELIFDAAENSKISISTTSWGGGASTIAVNTLPITSAKSPTGKVAQFTYYNHASGTWIVKFDIPFEGTYDNFQGYAIWVDIAPTEEEYTGGFNVTNVRPGTGKHLWTLIDTEGNVVDYTGGWFSDGMRLNLGKGFTGWVVIDKASWTTAEQAGILPSANTYLEFRFAGGNRTTPFTMNIGQVLAFSDKTALINELSSNSKDFYEYSFSDGNGYIYKAGQVSAGSSIIIPENPVHSDQDVFFAGWDTNRDGVADELPLDGKLTKDLHAVALFYHSDAFETYDEGTTLVWSKEEAYISISNEEYADSPTGKAVKLEINKDANGTGVVYAKLKLPVNDAVGVAFWMDASSVSSFGFRMFKNWIAKQTVAENGDYVYLYGEDGSLTMFSGWRKITVPSNFKGWVIVPYTAFASAKDVYAGDVLRLGFPFGEEGNAADFSANIYVGEAVTFNCTPEMFMSQIDKRVYGFVDYDGSFVASGVLADGQSLPTPENPVRDGWTFVGWDINNDGVADELPITTGRNFVAKAVYTRQFTYKFVDQDDNVILEATGEYNSLVLPPFRYMSNDNYYTYTLEHLDYVDGTYLTENMVFRVNITKTPKTFTVTFVDENGNVLQEEVLSYGDMPVFNGTMPSKPATAQYTYTARWNKDITTVSGNVTYKLVFDATVNKYKVIFYDSDNKTVLDEQMVPYGEVPTYNGKTPTKANDDKNKYTFEGWNKAIVKVTGETSYVAQYKAEPLDGHYHDYSNDWEKDETNHWKECQCGVVKDRAAHSYIENIIKEATDTTEGLIEYKCSVCGDSYTETIPTKVTETPSTNPFGCLGSIYGTLFATLILSVGLFIIRKRKKSL